MSTNTRSSRGWLLALVSIGVVAAGLRFLSLGYGLPAVYNPDETPILNRALALAKGDPNPHNFLYPSLYFYSLFAWEALFFLVGRVAGVFGSLHDFQQEFFTDPSRLFLAGRSLTAMFGIATVPAIYWYGRRLYGRTAGVAAAAFLAVAPIAVRDAHYVKLDVPVTLFVALAHAALARIVTDPVAAASRRTWLLAGLFAGLAVSTHYYAAFIVVPVVAVAVATATRSGDWRMSVRLCAWAGAAGIAGFVVGTPFLMFEPRVALQHIAVLRQVNIDRAVLGGGGVFSSFGSYARLLFFDAVGWPVCVLAVCGFAWALVADWRRGVLLGSFTLAFLLFISNTVPMTRYLNVVLPMFALAAAFTVGRVADLFGRRAPLAAAVVTAAALVPGLMTSIRTDLLFREDDTRTIARGFVESHLPSGTSILVQPYSAPLRPSREGLIEALRENLGSEQRASVKFQLMLSVDPYPSPAYRLIYLGDGGEDPEKVYVSPTAFVGSAGLAPLRALRVSYVILKRDNIDNPALQPLRAALAREGRRIAEFSPYRPDATPADRLAVPPFLHNTAARIHPALARPGPGIEIWSIE